MNGVVLMLRGWVRRTFGEDSADLTPTALGGAGRHGMRVFYGHTQAIAERKARRDLEVHGGVFDFDDGHDAQALRLQRAHQRAHVDPARDCPPCPSCSVPCGTGEDAPGKGWLRCGACGEPWQATAAELAQAKRADAAYRAERDAEERDALTFEAMPAPLREVNRRLLEQLEARRQAPAGEQLSLLGGEP